MKISSKELHAMLNHCHKARILQSVVQSYLQAPAVIDYGHGQAREVEPERPREPPPSMGYRDSPQARTDSPYSRGDQSGYGYHDESQRYPPTDNRPPVSSRDGRHIQLLYLDSLKCVCFVTRSGMECFWPFGF